MPAGAAAHVAAAARARGRRPGRRRAGRGRQPAYVVVERLRLGHRCHPPDRRLRHAGRARRRPSEVRLIVAHELGHAKERDVVWGTLMGAVGVALVVCVLALLGRWQWLLAPSRGATSLGGRPRGRAGAGAGGAARLRGRAGAEPDVAAGRDPGRRARAGPDARPGGDGGDAAAAVGDEPVRPRPVAAGVRDVRDPPDRRRSGSRWPATGRGCTACPFRRDCRGDPHPRRHQRLPAAGRAASSRSCSRWCSGCRPGHRWSCTPRASPGTRPSTPDLAFPVVRDPSRIMLPTPADHPAVGGDREARWAATRCGSAPPRRWG